jgi:hypothetical protein
MEPNVAHIAVGNQSEEHAAQHPTAAHKLLMAKRYEYTKAALGLKKVHASL